MLHAARLAAPAGVPLLGVNHGRLGFLADIGPQEVSGRLDEVMAGRYIEERRGMIRASIEGRIAHIERTNPGNAVRLRDLLARVAGDVH